MLWFDLRFDVQVPRHRRRELPEDVLASISAYYARVTTAARPMNRLIVVAMLATIVAIVIEITNGGSPPWVAWVSLGLAGAAILLAGIRTVPSAVRLGTREDTIEVQSRLARSIYREHLFCIAAISVVFVAQLAIAR